MAGGGSFSISWVSSVETTVKFWEGKCFAFTEDKAGCGSPHFIPSQNQGQTFYLLSKYLLKMSPHYQPLIPVSFTVMFLNTKHGLDIDCPPKALCVGALGPQVVDPVTKR